MSRQPDADPEMVNLILTSVQTPELRSLLLKIVSDQRITDSACERLIAYLTGQRPRKTWPRIRGWAKSVLCRS